MVAQAQPIFPAHYIFVICETNTGCNASKWKAMNTNDPVPVLEFPDDRKAEFSLEALRANNVTDYAPDVSAWPIRAKFLADRPTPDDWPIFD
jgi:hypothetical protein